jgi:hypothetical protein
MAAISTPTAFQTGTAATPVTAVGSYIGLLPPLAAILNCLAATYFKSGACPV